MAIKILNDQSITGTLSVVKSTSLPLLNIFNNSNGSGSTIKFSDISNLSQTGSITYVHTDTQSYGSGNAFILTGDQTSMTILADGKLMYKEGIYSKPATGTGAGTRKDSNWDSAYNNKVTAISDSGTSTTTITLTQQDGGTLSTSFSNPQGTITSSGSITGYSGSLIRTDNRTIAPNEYTAGRLNFGFTSWGNNNSSPYADFLHMSSYTDSSGGSPNLLMLKKSGIGMRIWQQSWNSSNAYANYEDVYTTADPVVEGTGVTSQIAVWSSSTSIIDGPVSFSGNNATFGGTIFVPEYITHLADTNNFIRFQGSRMTLQTKASGSAKVDLHNNGNLYLVSGGSTSLTLDTSKNATFAGKVKLANYWDSSVLTNNSIYAQNSTDGFAFGVGTNISTWFAYDSANGVNDMISVQNDGSKVTIHENLFLGNVDTSSDSTTALVLNSSGTLEVEKRTLGSGAFGPTPIGSYLPLSGGTMLGDIVMADELLNFATGGNVVLPQFIGPRNSTDLNSRTWNTQGAWSYTTFDNGTTNQPSAGLHNANGLLTLNTHSGAYFHQLAMTTNTGKLWHRVKNGGSYGSWGQIWQQSDFANNSTNWNTSYSNMITGVAVTGTTTKTITLTQQDGGTVSNTFTAGVVQSVTPGNTSTITIGGSTANPTVAANTAAVNASSANLATGAQIQTAINTALTGVLQFEGTWNASTNSPALASNVGTSGEYYIVSVAGNTNLNGITDWQIGDWAVFSNTTWTKIDNSQVGNVTGTGSSGKVAFWNSASNITNDGDLLFDGANLTVGGNIIGTSNNTTELGTYATGAIKRIRMVQGGELHFGDTTTAAPLGITEGNWNSFSDNDFKYYIKRNI